MVTIISKTKRECCHFRSPKKGPQLQSSYGASEASNWSGKGLREGSLGTTAVIWGEKSEEAVGEGGFIRAGLTKL